MPSGSGGIVVDVRVFNRHGIAKDERSITIERAEIDAVQQDKIVEEEILERSIKQRASTILEGTTINKKIKDFEINTKLNNENIEKLTVSDILKVSIEDSKKNDALKQLKDQYDKAKQEIKERIEEKF